MNWGERWDLNPRSPGPQPGALTTGLRSPQPPLLYFTDAVTFNLESEPFLCIDAGAQRPYKPHIASRKGSDRLPPS